MVLTCNLSFFFSEEKSFIDMLYQLERFDVKRGDCVNQENLFDILFVGLSWKIRTGLTASTFLKKQKEINLEAYLERRSRHMN